MYPKSASSGKLNWCLGNPKMSNWIASSSKSSSSPKQCDCYDVDRINAYTAKAMVLACMDFRLRDSIGCQLNKRGYHNNYDEVISAGASLGYNGLLDYTNWTTYIDEHVKLAYDLHAINEIIIVDHEGCGAYKAQYGDASYNLQKHYNNIKLCVDVPAACTRRPSSPAGETGSSPPEASSTMLSRGRAGTSPST